MPIYEYHCPSCGSDFEKLVRGRIAVACPSCESREVTRRFSTFGIGSGSAGVAPVGAGGASCKCGAGGCGSC